MQLYYYNGQATNYQISETGKLYNLKTKKFLKGSVNKLGYLVYRVSLNGFSKDLYAHRMVAETYIQKPIGKDCVNHKDGNKLNNCYTNLEWCSNLQNMRHAWKNGLIVANKYEKNGRSKLTEEQVKKIKKDLNNGRTAVSLAKEYEVSASTIDCIKQKRTWVGIE